MKYILKKLGSVLLGLIWFTASCAISLAACEELTPFSVSVTGYYRSDGTYVRGHTRRPPGGAKHDKPYEILGFISFLSTVGSAAFVGVTVNTLRKEWRYELKHSDRNNPFTQSIAQTTPSHSASDGSLEEASTQKIYNSTKMLLESSTLEGLISEAIAGGKRISFKYTNKSGEHSIRTIKPVGFKRFKEEVSVYGYCYLRNSERTFALSRISRARCAD